MLRLALRAEELNPPSQKKDISFGYQRIVKENRVGSDRDKADHGPNIADTPLFVGSS